MFVYSKTIIRFASEIKDAIKHILTQEIRLKCAGGRFYDRLQRTSYPINVVIYNNKSMLGYFDPHFYELGFHECLMQANKDQLHNIIRHELAHYITFTIHGHTVQPHAAEFKDFCIRLGWDEKVYRATTALDHEQTIADLEESSVFRKVKKLMALSTSCHANEAEQALTKSQQLLLKHNLESKYIGRESDEKICMQRIMKQKKETAKMRAIASILKTFFVSIVYHRGGEFTYLEILGNAVNIEIAEYVAKVLEIELEKLWLQAQKTAHLKGAIAKNSFFLGIAKGYCNKIQALKKEHTQEVANALIVLEKQLIDAQSMVYSRLSSKTTSASYCPSSGSLGEKMGRQLKINPAINQSSKDSGRLLT
jgi:hypothetical protein